VYKSNRSLRLESVRVLEVRIVHL